MFCKLYYADNFQNGDLKYFPYSRTLTAYPTPVLMGTPDFFFLNIRMTINDEVKDIT